MDGETKDKNVASNYAYIAGVTGAHHYYLGETGKGIMRSLACLFLGFLFFVGDIGFFGFFALIATLFANVGQGIRLATMRQDAFDLKYNPHLFVKKADMQEAMPIVGIAEEIHKLNQLFEKGIINFEEFERRKKRLLD